MNKKFILLFAFVILKMSIAAQEETPGRFSIETDPTTYFFDGCSLQLRLSSFLIEKLSLGIGVYQAAIPDFYLEENSQNKNKGWEAKVEIGFDLYVDYYFSDPYKGWFAGAGFSVYEFEIGRLEETTSYVSLVETLRAGYTWRPYYECFYVSPWIGYSINQQVSGSNSLLGESLELPSGSFVGTIQVGLSL